MYRIRIVLMLSVSIIVSVSAQETLRKYADKIGLSIGVCMGSQFDNNNTTHNNLVKQEFNTVVAENSMKAQYIHPSKGKTSFGGPDKLLKFAQENNMQMRGHTLVWHSQNAGWICSGSRQTSLENMKYHIETVMSHFKGKIFQWDVVNEAMDDASGKLRSSDWTKSIGDDFIDSAFVYAHAADPDAKLFYNDYSTTTINTKSTAIYNMVKKMVDNGIPIHGVGFQCHQSATDGNDGLYNKVKENFDRFAALGLDIAITELDAKGSDQTAQAKVYSTLMQIAIDMPAVTTYMIWGVRDQDSWVSPTPLMYNNSWQPKAAYTAVLEVLKTAEIVRVAGRTGQIQRVSEPAVRFERAGNVVVLRNVPEAGASVDMFDLRGAKTATFIMPSSGVIPLSSLRKANGVAIVKSGSQTLRDCGLISR